MVAIGSLTAKFQTQHLFRTVMLLLAVGPFELEPGVITIGGLFQSGYYHVGEACFDLANNTRRIRLLKHAGAGGCVG